MMTTQQEFSSTLNGEPIFPLALLEHRAVHDADTVWARMPISTNTYDEGFRDITYAQLSNAVDGTYHWIETETGTRQKGDVIAYFGLWDPRYILYLLAASKAGYTIVWPSPKFSVDILNKILVQDLDCKLVITATEPNATVQEFISSNDLAYRRSPSLDFFLNQKHEHVPFTKHYEEAADDLLIVLHTSGSTSYPKPIYWTNRWLASYFRQNLIDPPEGYESINRLHQGEGKRVMAMLPVMHCGNLFGHMISAFGTKAICHYPLPTAPLHLDTWVEMMKHVTIDTVAFAAMIAEQLRANPGVLAKTAEMVSHVGYAGGLITHLTAETLTEKMKVFPLFGSTENGLWPTIYRSGPWDPKTWQRITLHPKSNIKFDQVGDSDGRAEAVVTNPLGPGQHGHDSRIPPALQAFPQLDEWRSGDLFYPDPADPNSWYFSGRFEDIIRFTDGSVSNPLPFEDHIGPQSGISAAVLIGLTKPNAALILEPSAQSGFLAEDKAELIDKIYPYVEQANKTLARQFVVNKADIIVSDPGELPRAFKGTVQRPKVLKMYQHLLEKRELCVE